MPKAIQYTNNSVIYFENNTNIDDRIFILQRGKVNLVSTDIETGQLITESINEGECFGVKSAIGHFPREETARVVSDSQVLVLSIQEFEKLATDNGKIIIKMLKVFSNQLRVIHKKTQAVLNSKQAMLPEEGMLAVAEGFLNDRNFSAAYDVCTRFFCLFKNSPLTEKAARIYSQAKAKVGMSGVTRSVKHAGSSENAPEGASWNSFTLRGFSRFAKKYSPGDLIFSEFEPGHTFYLIQSGRIQLMKYVKGVTKNLDILYPSEIFGEMAVMENSPRSATALALDEVEVLEFNKENFETLILGTPQIAIRLLKMFCKRIYDQKRRFKTLVIQDMQARVGDVFLMLDETELSPQRNEFNQRFDITIQDIAHWAGLSAEAVTDEINRFLDKRKIEVYADYMIVKSMGDMRRFVESKRNKK
ncbi:MAG: cyclic nucleotide-binding domain-containing protein [Spirochaetaceae bacterium]|nr:cyclic nucleotide-binding domain-containing protein [Spirochaetaceae bacterium]